MNCKILSSGEIYVMFDEGAEQALVNLLFSRKDCDQIAFEKTADGTYVARPNFADMVPIPHGMPMVKGLTPDGYQMILSMLRDRAKLRAIKLFKELTGWGLKESKDWIDELAGRLTP